MDFIQDIIERKREKKKNKFAEWELECARIRQKARERDYAMLPDGSLVIP